MSKKSKQNEERRLQDVQVIESDSASKSGLEKIYLLVIEWGTYLALFTPLIFSPFFFFPYVVPKTIFFRIIVDVIFIAYMLLVVSKPKYKPRINILTISIFVFLLISFLASVAGVNFSRSFWSTFERMTGLLTFFHLFAFYIVLTSVFKKRKDWERILTVSILIGVLLVFYVFTSNESTARGGGTLGNTSFMSAYLLFDIFFAIILFFTKKGFWKIFYAVALVPLIWLLFFPPQEPTQGAIGAFVGGIFILAFSYLLFRLFVSGSKLLKKMAVALIVFTVLFGAAFTQTGFFKEKLAEVERSSSWEARAIVWNMGLEGWKERPLLGWGEENFNVPFTKYFDPSLPPSGDIWYDRVHNIVIDLLISSGVLGLLSYLAIFGVAAFGLLRISLRVGDKQNVFLPLGMMALLIVYFAQDIWVFDMVSSYMMFFLSLAFIYFLIQGKEEEGSEEKRMPVNTPLAALLIIVSLITIYFGNIQPSRAANLIVRGISLPLNYAVPSIKKAISISPISSIEGPEQLSKKVTGLTFDDDVDGNVLREGFRLAEEELKKAIDRNPLDYRLRLVLGRQYNDFYRLTGDPQYLDLSEEIMNSAKELSPKNQQTYWTLAQTALSREDREGAVSYMQEAVDLEPNFLLAKWYLAMTYKAVGDYETAWEKAKELEATEFNWKSEFEYLKQVIDVLQNLTNDEELVRLYPLAIEMVPKDPQLKAGLGVAYARLGQYDQARFYIEEALKMNPDFADEMRQFLDSLPQ